MTTTRTLAWALRQAGSELERELPPPELRSRTSAAVAARLAAHSSGCARRVVPWPRAWSGAIACAALALGSVLLMLSNPEVQPVAPPQMSEFMPVVPQDQWPAGDAPAWLVSTELRRDRLAALGLPYDPARAGDSVRAELLMRASGEVLAVRFLQ